ncbi:substrate-binding periplasmic protein [Aestuariispira insulae]|uniref:Amino acid ABC transporter substrate-binding protein (PAAT family) n=1 Tax=Aestuariispira insulae TaxID=1461337 RepID=A0A3D9HRR4_9PROT|nr:transporter substrate-binding domain-containing protein [Aestuariispira insulae]RED52149.1 hypothetical protein DFP90_102167 [Aestuariispira insulae]
MKINTYRSGLFAAWLLAVWLPFPHQTKAGEAPRVVVWEAFPEAYRDQAGDLQGTLVDFTRLLEQDYGQPFQLEVSNWPRIMAGVGTNQYDIAYFFHLSSLEPKLHYLGLMGCLADLFIPRQGIKVSNLDSLAGLRVGFLKNAVFDRATRDDNRFEKLPVQDTVTVLRLLARDRIDLAVVHSGHYARLLRSTGTPERYPGNWRDKLGEPVVHALYRVEVTLSRQSNLQDQIEKFRAIIRKNREDGNFAAIMEKHNMPFWPCDEMD